MCPFVIALVAFGKIINKLVHRSSLEQILKYLRNLKIKIKIATDAVLW
jgi:hypothetical protein